MRDLCGKPLIAWSIDAAKGSRYIDKILVTTDDADIQQCAIKHGAQAPFLRPAELASDTASSVDAVLHAYDMAGDNADYILLLQPTSPLRTREHIDAGIEKAVDGQSRALISVTELEHPVQHQRQLDEQGHLIRMMEYDKKQAYRRQDFSPVYRINGAIYLIKSDMLREAHDFELPGTISYVMDRSSSIDIDDIYDFELAEYYLSKREDTVD